MNSMEKRLRDYDNRNIAQQKCYILSHGLFHMCLNTVLICIWVPCPDKEKQIVAVFSRPFSCALPCLTPWNLCWTNEMWAPMHSYAQLDMFISSCIHFNSFYNKYLLNRQNPNTYYLWFSFGVTKQEGIANLVKQKFVTILN